VSGLTGPWAPCLTPLLLAQSGFVWFYNPLASHFNLKNVRRLRPNQGCGCSMVARLIRT
jgi:hypothetical protein